MCSSDLDVHDRRDRPQRRGGVQRRLDRRRGLGVDQVSAIRRHSGRQRLFLQDEAPQRIVVAGEVRGPKSVVEKNGKVKAAKIDLSKTYTNKFVEQAK